MTTPAQPLAKCALNALYALTSAELDKLRAIIEGLIVMIDAQILWLRSQIAAIDIMKFLIGSKWEVAKAAIDQFNAALAGGIPGPAGNICPEFQQYITDPIIGMNKATLAALTPIKDKYGRLLSIGAQFDRLIVYWESIKAQLFAILDVIDDALFLLKEQAGNQVP